MTERLYYADPYCTRFFAQTVEQTIWDSQPAVVLNRTAFYHASGGQPADGGTLSGIRLLDIVVREQDGAIVHILEHALPPDKDEVEGVLDWPRRFDHMQQHTGQHILSAAFEQVLDADTVGFHLGTEVSTIDINVARLDPVAAKPVEELANRVVWENRPIHTRFVDIDELATLHLRRPPTVEGPVRIVEVADFDVNPCGGTHVAHAGEIGLIKITNLDYRGNETRVEFLCGDRAAHDYQAKNEMIHQLTSLLTVGYWELDQAVERLQAEAKQLRHDLRKARTRLLEVEANELAETAVVIEPYRVVAQVWEQREPSELRALAQELAQIPNLVALLASVGKRTNLCFSRAEGMDVDVAAALQAACAQLGGKGGGRPHLAQGSAPAADASQVQTMLMDLLNT